MSIFDIILHYLQLGFTHVIPLGYDHILFILSVFFLNSRLRSIIIQCSIFTIAHSISLGITTAGFISPPSSIIEPLIALSILVTAVENIIHSHVHSWRLVIIFLFGLIHGMGFANALKEVGLPQTHFLTALIGFNCGVEIGQLVVIFCAYIFVVRWFGTKEWYSERIVYPISSIIGSIAFYWLLQRIFFP